MKSPTVTLGTTDLQYSKNEPSPCKAISFALVIILGVGSLAVVGAVYLKIGAFSTLAQVNAITLMTTSGAAGMTLLTIGIVGSVKNCQTIASEQSIVEKDVNDLETKRVIEIEHRQLRISDAVTFGPDKLLSICGIKVKGDISAKPKFDLFANDPYYKAPFHENYFLLFVPSSVSASNEDQALTPKILKEIMGDKFPFRLHLAVENGCEGVKNPGWILISKRLIPGTLAMALDDQKEFTKQEGGRVSLAIEALLLVSLLSIVDKKTLEVGKVAARCTEWVTGFGCGHPSVEFGSRAVDLVGSFTESNELGALFVKDLF